MKVTIDSSESLQDALRVVGALYNRELVVAAPASVATENGDTEPSTVARSTAATEPAAVPARKATTRRRKASSTAKPKTSPTAKAKASGRTSKSAAPNRTKRPALPSTAELRSWAQANGQRVSDRGRVSSAVVAAYQEAHQS